MWSVTQAAQILGISVQRVRRLLAEDRIKGQKMGRDWVVLELSYTRRKRRTKAGVLYIEGKEQQPGQASKK
jgi:excisionase family DNA binding protein